ncbi:lipid acyl hydrolase [Sclerotinia borealis F-4128]|uniref:Lipid acyl hydrolase n=1 Tax=Sclerotinia borealis (strain F-4128) TaxID=1432307 RepID=W9BYV9_SCLBF|nr:lipid acyl hydrolase [Sclerotinia borealis F-4128]
MDQYTLRSVLPPLLNCHSYTTKERLEKAESDELSNLKKPKGRRGTIDTSDYESDDEATNSCLADEDPLLLHEDDLFDTTLMSSSPTNTKVNSAANYFQNLKNISNNLESERYLGDIRVKVAILGTGLHSLHPLDHEFNHYKEFIEPSTAFGHVKYSRHDFRMASLLRKVAPFCEIYIARVFDGGPIELNSAIPAAKAIIHARDVWKLDIISMSFGFKDENAELLKAINDTHNTLIFAAASNYGANEDPPIRFPARMKDRVICINAADGYGNPSECNPPNPKRENFSVLGEAVPLDGELVTGSKPSVKYGCGTSMETQIAAGVAALVLEFARQDQDRPHRVRDVESLRTKCGMSAVLRAMTKGGARKEVITS